MQLKRQIPLLAMAALVGLAGMSGLAVPPVHAQTAQAIPVRPNPARVQQKMREIEKLYAQVRRETVRFAVQSGATIIEYIVFLWQD